MTESMAAKIGFQDPVVDSLVKLLDEQGQVPHQGLKESGAHALRNMAFTEDNTLRIVKDERALRVLVNCLARQDHPEVQKLALGALQTIAEFEEAKSILQGTEGLLDSLMSLLGDGTNRTIQRMGARALTFINPAAGKEARLSSAEAYRGRARAFIDMGMYAEALPDLNQAVDLLEGADNIFGLRCAIKARLGDLEGALQDANEAVKVCNSDNKWLTLTERGVLKRMSGDLEGALEDLDQGFMLKLENYQILKHRGFVKFLLNDEEGARADAERALRFEHSYVDGRQYEKSVWLGHTPIEYLGYKLK